MRLLGTVVTVVALALAASPAQAQIADAIGKPLPRGDLETGQVTVRVVEGDMGKPVASADVRLTIQGGEPRVARTDASGRANFIGLAPRTMVSVATDGKEGEVKSVDFQVPNQGGIAVLLSTVPFDASSMMGGGGPAMGGGGMPEPRKMAGQPRPEQNDPGGQLTVRLSYNDLTKMEGLGDVPVVLAAYAADGRVAAKVVRSDASGRAVVPNLDVSGDTAYYALAMLPRGAATDRLMSLPIVPVADIGMRVILSGEKQDSGAPRVDDVERFIRQPNLPAGQVIVAIGGDMLEEGTVELVDIGTQEVVATAPLGRGRPIPDSISATFGDLAPSDTLPAGVVEVSVVVSMQGQKLGLPRAPVTIRSTSGAPYSATLQSGQDGKVTIPGAPVGRPLEAIVDVQGKPFTSAPFTLSADKGATLEASTRFELLSLVEAAFEGVAPNPEGAYLAQLRHDGELYRTPPFQVPPERGVVAPMFVMPRIELTFQLDVRFEDDFLAASGNFLVQNASWAPYAGQSEGLRIPAPRGATGLVVAEMDQQWVAADGNAFRLTRAVPPLGGDFRAGFSIPADSSTITWDLPLPLGSAGSSLAVRMDEGMKVDLPPGVSGRKVPQPNGTTWYAIQGINIPQNQRMVFEISGLPQRPAWIRWSRRFAGGVVVMMLVGGVVLGVWMRRARQPAAGGTRKDRKRRIEQLLDEVAEIERGKGDPARREAAIAELEQLYREDAAPPGA